MKMAMEIASIVAEYQPTTHAINRARIRYGIEPAEAAEWINDCMRNATMIGRDGTRHGNPIYESEEGVRFVINPNNNTVITVLGDTATDFLRPALERELRKLNRFYTRSIRQSELEYAHALRELSDMAINRARARNPKTRELIAERMSDKQADIDGLLTDIERMNDEWKAKKRAIEVISE